MFISVLPTSIGAALAQKISIGHNNKAAEKLMCKFADLGSSENDELRQLFGLLDSVVAICDDCRVNCVRCPILPAAELVARCIERKRQEMRALQTADSSGIAGLESS